MKNKTFIEHKFRAFILFLWCSWIALSILLLFFSPWTAFAWIFSGLMVFITITLSGCYSGFWYITKGRYYRKRGLEVKETTALGDVEYETWNEEESV